MNWKSLKSIAFDRNGFGKSVKNQKRTKMTEKKDFRLRWSERGWRETHTHTSKSHKEKEMFPRNLTRQTIELKLLWQNKMKECREIPVRVNNSPKMNRNRIVYRESLCCMCDRWLKWRDSLRFVAVAVVVVIFHGHIRIVFCCCCCVVVCELPTNSIQLPIKCISLIKCSIFFINGISSNWIDFPNATFFFEEKSESTRWNLRWMESKKQTLSNIWINKQVFGSPIIFIYL